MSCTLTKDASNSSLTGGHNINPGNVRNNYFACLKIKKRSSWENKWGVKKIHET